MLVLGINDLHNSSACLIRDGAILGCVQEERFTGIKNQSGFPSLSLRWLIESNGLGLGDVDKIVFNSDTLEFPPPVNGDFDSRLISRVFSAIPSPLASSDVFFKTYAKLSKTLRRMLPKKRDLGKEVWYCDHHYAHAASAYYLSGLKSKTLVVTCDGSGGGACATISIGDGLLLERKITIPVFHSIGNFYTRATWTMGFVPWQDEHKLMGLSGYWSDASPGLFDGLFSTSSLKFINNSGRWGNSMMDHISKKLAGQRFDYAAFSVQKLLECVVLPWVKNAINHFDLDTIALSGGVFMNVKLNKLISDLEEVENIYVLPSCGDESSAMGAAIAGYLRLCKERGANPLIKPLGPIYLGPEYNAEDSIAGVDKKRFDVEHLDSADEVAGEMISKGKIVARCSGRLEFGSRALGNRSILTDPRDGRTMWRLNKLKGRDFWMPFAPTILEERNHEYLMNPKDFDSPYMMLAFDTTELNEEIAAAIHPADHTARAQILEEEWNPGYYRLIKEFEDITGTGGILNTSLNLHGSPIACTPMDAIRILENSQIDCLLIDDYLVTRK